MNRTNSAGRSVRVGREQRQKRPTQPRKQSTKSYPRKTWAIYTYIAGDNDLSNYGLLDIREMEHAGGSKDVHVVAQIDTTGEYTGSVRYEISEPDFEDTSHRIVIQRLPEQNTGSPQYLAKFARWAAERYPAEHRLLVVWNHGAGFMHTATRDIGYDDSSQGDALTMGELRWALQRAGFGRGKLGKLAVIGFDACLMNMVEVAYEFSGFSDFIVGSQQVEPGDGWPYHDVVACMRNGPTPQIMIASIVKKYIAAYRKVGEVGVTQSALCLNHLPALGRALEGFANVLKSLHGVQRGKILEARIRTQGYAEPTYVDLVDLTKNISALILDKRVKHACSAVRAAVDDVVVESETYGQAVKRSCGISIWFPLLRDDYVTRRSEYVALRYTKEFPKWASFLDELLAV